MTESNTTPSAQSDIEQLLRELQAQRFYGALEMKLEGGRVVLLRKTETIKPAGENRGNLHGKRS